MQENTQTSQPAKPEKISFAEFLENHPPNQLVEIEVLAVGVQQGTNRYRGIFTPEIRLHCPESSCGGVRFFRCITAPPPSSEHKYVSFFLTYRCSNCQRTEKIFSISAQESKADDSGSALKYGELPPFGPPTPSRLITLIGPDRDIFLKGRRCENQGLGIGAFIYYRRVVEQQKSRIIEEIIKVSRRVGAKEDVIKTLQAAVKETRFSEAIDIAKDAIPESLLISGHNPLLLLHAALSEGVHAKSDEECLSTASSIRVVLAELSDRMGQALKDEDELRNALSTLLNKKG